MFGGYLLSVILVVAVLVIAVLLILFVLVILIILIILLILHEICPPIYLRQGRAITMPNVSGFILSPK